MASPPPMSGSVIKKGQAAMVCELCETDLKLKWKCLECKLMMCQRCRDKVHSKFASAADHTIIDIKEIGKHQEDSGRNPDLSRIKCETHRGQNCCFYCDTCECLVCQMCVIKTHKKHKFKEIKDAYEIKLNKIKNEQRKIGQGILALIVSQQKLKQVKSNEQLNYEKVKHEILQHDNALIEEIKRHSNKLLKELDQKWEAVSNTIDCETKRLKDDQKQTQEQKDDLNSLLRVDQAADLFSIPESILRSRNANTQPLQMSINAVPRFIQGEIKGMSHSFGTLKEVVISINTEPQVEAQYDTDLTVITSVHSCPDGSFWICDASSDIVERVKQKKRKLSILDNIDIKVLGSAFLPSGDLLLSVKECSNIKLIPYGSTDIKDSVYTVSPLQPRSVHVTRNNKIIIGVRETGPPFPVNGPRNVIVMNQIGKQEKVFQYDSHGKPLFTYPVSITTNAKGTIAVVDKVSDDFTGRVVVLDQEGEVRNIYTGHPDINDEDNPFTPMGITTTPSDNFVITDMDNHTLHILNNEGEIVRFYNTEEMGILFPYSPCFSTTGLLYIGSSIPQNSKERAKLFTVDNYLF